MARRPVSHRRKHSDAEPDLLLHRQQRPAEDRDSEAYLPRPVPLGRDRGLLLALSDDGRPAYNPEIAARIAALGAPVFACTPDQFPSLMAAALRRQDLHAWAATEDIKLVRPAE
jgi:hypothetical protein